MWKSMLLFLVGLFLFILGFALVFGVVAISLTILPSNVLGLLFVIAGLFFFIIADSFSDI